MADVGPLVPVNDPSRAALAGRAELASRFERFLASGRYVHGPEHAAFEREFASYVGVRHCVGLASGTDALELALVCVGCAPGEIVLTAANCGGYATTAARRADLRVRFMDVDPSSLLVTRSTVEAALTSAVRAVVVTHLYGALAEVESIVSLCRDRGIPVVEDCAHAAGAKRGDSRAGSFGDAAAFSFYPTKTLAALGDGGALLTDSEPVAEHARRLRQYGWGEKGEVLDANGRNSRLDELQAVVLRARLPLLDVENERRRAIAREYAAALPPEAGRLVALPGEDYVAHLAVVLVEDRDRVRRALGAAGIETDVHYPVGDHRQPAWRDDYRDLTLPVTEHASEHVLTLPCFPGLTDGEIARVCQVLHEL